MHNRAKKSDSSDLIVGVLIGSVAGMALGALISRLLDRFVGKAWDKVTQRGQSRKVDPRWLLQ